MSAEKKTLLASLADLHEKFEASRVELRRMKKKRDAVGHAYSRAVKDYLDAKAAMEEAIAAHRAAQGGGES